MSSYRAFLSLPEPRCTWPISSHWCHKQCCLVTQLTFYCIRLQGNWDRKLRKPNANFFCRRGRVLWLLCSLCLLLHLFPLRGWLLPGYLDRLLSHWLQLLLHKSPPWWGHPVWEPQPLISAAGISYHSCVLYFLFHYSYFFQTCMLMLLFSCVRLFATPWTAARQACLSMSLLKLMSVKSVMPFNHLILCPPFLLSPSIFSSIRIFSRESEYKWLILLIFFPIELKLYKAGRFVFLFLSPALTMPGLFNTACHTVHSRFFNNHLFYLWMNLCPFFQTLVSHWHHFIGVGRRAKYFQPANKMQPGVRD